MTLNKESRIWAVTMMTEGVVGGCRRPCCSSRVACTAGTCITAATSASALRAASVDSATVSGSGFAPKLLTTSAHNCYQLKDKTP